MSRTERQQQISKLEQEIRKLNSKRVGENSDSENERKKKTKHSFLDEELAKYEKGRGLKAKKGGKGKKQKDEVDVLARMSSFKSKLGSLSYDEVEESAEGKDAGDDAEGVEVDNDIDFLGHRLLFPKGNEEEVNKAERDYEVIDPRKRGAQAKQEDRDRRRQSRQTGKSFRR